MSKKALSNSLKSLIERAVMLVLNQISSVANFLLAGQCNMRGSVETFVPNLQIIAD